jgi:hypothetical protein
MKIASLFILLILDYFYTTAQSWQIGVNIKPLISYPSFKEGDYAHPSMRCSPLMLLGLISEKQLLLNGI